MLHPLFGWAPIAFRRQVLGQDHTSSEVWRPSGSTSRWSPVHPGLPPPAPSVLGVSPPSTVYSSNALPTLFHAGTTYGVQRAGSVDIRLHCALAGWKRFAQNNYRSLANELMQRPSPTSAPFPGFLFFDKSRRSSDSLQARCLRRARPRTTRAPREAEPLSHGSVSCIGPCSTCQPRPHL